MNQFDLKTFRQPCNLMGGKKHGKKGELPFSIFCLLLCLDHTVIANMVNLTNEWHRPRQIVYMCISYDRIYNYICMVVNNEYKNWNKITYIIIYRFEGWHWINSFFEKCYLSPIIFFSLRFAFFWDNGLNIPN